MPMITPLQGYAIALLGTAICNLHPVQAQMQGNNTYSNPAIEQSEAYIQGNPYQKDALLFIDLIQSTHPAFATNADTPFDANKVGKESYRQAAEFQSTAELQSCLQEIATRLEDGHTTLMLPFDNSSIYPFALFLGDCEVYLQATNREHASSLGGQVVQINRQPVERVIDSFRKAISSDNKVHFRSKVGQIMQLHSMWANNPYAQADSTLLLTFADGQSLTLHPVPKERLDIVWAQPQAANNALVKPTKAPFSYTILAEQKLCYLFFNACADQHTAREQLHAKYGDRIPEQMEQKLAQIPQFELFLEQMFHDMTEQQVATLVIDVRHNSGGNSRLCNQLLSWLKPSNKINFYHAAIRFSPLWEQHYPTLAARYRTAFAACNIPFEMNKIYESTWLASQIDNQQKTVDKRFNTQTDNSKKTIFNGRILFIQSTKTYSSAGLLITQAADNRIGTIIGEESSYKPCHYGDILMWELPNTKLKGSISHKYFSRPDSSKCKESSLRPDFVLTPTWEQIQNGRDLFQEFIFGGN